MSPLGKAFLRHYLDVKTNIATIATFVERLAMVSNNSKNANIVTPTTMIDLEVVGTVVNSIQNQNERSKLDIYLLTNHPSEGNALYNTYHKEESIVVIGLKCTDPLIDNHGYRGGRDGFHSGYVRGHGYQVIREKLH
jgi:hypothetical protein